MIQFVAGAVLGVLVGKIYYDKESDLSKIANGYINKFTDKAKDIRSKADDIVKSKSDSFNKEEDKQDV